MHVVSMGSHLEYEITQPTVVLLNVSIATTPHQSVVSESLTVSPTIDISPLIVGAERNRVHRLLLQPGQVTINYSARAQLNPTTDQPRSIDQIDYAALPSDVLPYLNPSRYCESDRLAAFAHAEFGYMPPNFERVTAICDWVNTKISYRGGTTTATTTAADVLLQRAGVCRDFAHLAITFCRALGVPARYVSGYACRLEPPDFHGFFEAYIDGNWFLFDPTRLAPPAGLVRIGAGRDAADTAFATLWGAAELKKLEVWANEDSDPNELLDEHPSDLAVSTA